jgi:hypothetical protein
MPTIRIDSEVYAWLQGQGEPFEDTPNTVLRRVAGLEAKCRSQPRKRVASGMERLTAVKLAKKWGVEMRHGLYHREGSFFENLRDFPGVLFDPTGYVVFATKTDYQNSKHLRIGEKLNVPGGIRSIPGYIGIEE